MQVDVDQLLARAFEHILALNRQVAVQELILTTVCRRLAELELVDASSLVPTLKSILSETSYSAEEGMEMMRAVQLTFGVRPQADERRSPIYLVSSRAE